MATPLSLVAVEENGPKKVKKELIRPADVAAGVAVAAGFVINPLAAVGAAGVYKGVAQVTVHKKVKDQQYRALTAIMYMDALSEFMEG